MDRNILHMEDDDNDSLFVVRALSRLQFKGQYRRTSTVEETIDYLNRNGPFANQGLYPRPDILLVDSVLGTGKTTEDFADWLARQENFRQIVFIVLAGHLSDASQEKWLSRGARCVLSKGASLDELTAAVKTALEKCES